MNGELRVVEDVAAAFATLVAGELSAFAGRDDEGARFRFAMSGGPTARRCYERLAQVEGLPWSRVEVYWGDERCVPPDDVDSNARLGHEALLDRVGPFAGVHPMSCVDGAEAYEEVLRPVLPLDLVHLGLGPDGHTASLFPGADALVAPRDRLALVTSDPSARNPHQRMTVTLPVLDGARLAVFTVSGPEKREALAHVRAGGDVPGARVAAGRVVWLADAAAAG